MTSLRHGIHTAGKQRTEKRVRTILDLVRDEYKEMPDMALSLEQACTLWNAEPPVVARALDALVAEGYLHVSRNRYVRAR